MAEKGRMTAVELVDKLMGSEHADVVRESVAWLVAEVMEAEVSGQIGAGHGEVSAERVTQRNGYRERAWATRAGELELRIPKLRSGSYSRVFWSRADALSRRWSPSCRRPTSTASPRARSTGWSSRWACT
jgi:transposase-like protein